MSLAIEFGIIFEYCFVVFFAFKTNLSPKTAFKIGTIIIYISIIIKL